MYPNRDSRQSSASCSPHDRQAPRAKSPDRSGLRTKGHSESPIGDLPESMTHPVSTIFFYRGVRVGPRWADRGAAVPKNQLLLASAPLTSRGKKAIVYTSRLCWHSHARCVFAQIRDLQGSNNLVIDFRSHAVLFFCFLHFSLGCGTDHVTSQSPLKPCSNGGSSRPSQQVYKREITVHDLPH